MVLYTAGAAFGGDGELRLVETIGSSQHKVIDENCQYAQFSPDGRQIVYSRKHGTQYEVVLARRDGAQKQVLKGGFTAAPEFCWRAPRTIIYTHNLEAKAYSLDPSTGATAVFYSSTQRLFNFSVSTDLKRGCFYSRTKSRGIWTVDLTQGMASETHVHNGCGNWISPDGSLFSNNLATHQDMYVRNWNHTVAESLSIVSTGEFWNDHMWSNNSNDYIVYPRGKDYQLPGYSEVWVQNIRTGEATRITSGQAHHYHRDAWIGNPPPLIGAGPDLQLTPLSLDFAGVLGGAAPAGQTVDATAWNGLSLADLSVAKSAAWLTVSVSGTGASRSLLNQVNPAGLAAGDYADTVRVQADTVKRTYSVRFSLTDPSTLHIKMNAGNNSVPGWESDDAYVSGGADYVRNDVFNRNGAVNPGPNALYQTVRRAQPAFTFPQVPNGTYTVRLHFADPAIDSTVKKGTRAMVVLLEGRTVLNNYDIAAVAGGGHKVVIEEFLVTVSDGNGLSAAFFHGTGNDAFVAGIEILGGDVRKVKTPVFRFLSPAGGEALPAGGVHTVSWASLNAEDAVIEYSDDDGKSWKLANGSGSITIADSLWNRFPWAIPAAISAPYRIRISTYFGEGTAKSAVFHVRAPGNAVRADRAVARSLLSVIPYPVHGGARIRLILSRPGPVLLEIFDLAGRRAARLRAASLRGGAYEVDWPLRTAGNQPWTPGLYVVRANTPGSTLETRAFNPGAASR